MLYSADIEDSYRFYFYQLRPLVQPNSPLYTRLRMAFEGLGYTATKDVSLDRVEINRITENPAGIIVKKELRLGHDPQRRRPDITRAKTILGWEPKVSLAEGIQKTIPYFKERMAQDA